jgi:hypothetical protein
MSQQPEDRATDRPEIATAPPEAPGPGRGRVPPNLGPARTSTVVLAVLFLAIGALYLNVRPDPAPTATTGGGGRVEQPAIPTTPSVAPTTPTTATTPPTTASDEPTESEPATTEPTTAEPTGETSPTPTSDVPTPPETTVEPTGTPPG